MRITTGMGTGMATGTVIIGRGTVITMDRSTTRRRIVATMRRIIGVTGIIAAVAIRSRFMPARTASASVYGWTDSIFPTTAIERRSQALLRFVDRERSSTGRRNWPV